MKQDSEHMAALEEAYARLREQNRTMEQQLKVRCRPGAQAGAAGCMRMRMGMCCWVAWLAALQAAVFHACQLASPVSSPRAAQRCCTVLHCRAWWVLRAA